MFAASKSSGQDFIRCNCKKNVTRKNGIVIMGKYFTIANATIIYTVVINKHKINSFNYINLLIC